MEVGSSSNMSYNANTTKRPKRKFNIMNPFDMPGLRFTPTELDLVTYFIRMKIKYENFSFPEIHDVNIYDYNPQQLAEKFMPAKENEWYFFSSRDRKYPNGTRPNRAAGDGYWKATGADEHIKSDDGETFGYKKTLTFFQGKPPKGEKLGWIMNEFTLEVKPASNNSMESTNPNDMMLDKWVLCRIHEIINRSNKKAKKEDKSNDDHDQPVEGIPQFSQALQIYDTNNTTTNNDNSIYGAGNTQVANVENALVEHSNEPTNGFGEKSLHHINSTNVAPSVFDNYYPAMFNGVDPGPSNDYIPQVSQALQVYSTNNNDNNIYGAGNIHFANNENAILEHHSNELTNTFGEESLHRINSTNVDPLGIDYYSVGGQYINPAMFNGHSNHLDEYISQVPQALQVYGTSNNIINNNDNNIYVANNQSAIVEHLNEPMNAFAEESLHHINSTGVAPLFGGQYFPDRFGINVENVTENVCSGKLGQTNPAAGGSLDDFDKNTQLLNVPQNPKEHEQNYNDFWDDIDNYIIRMQENKDVCMV